MSPTRSSSLSFFLPRVLTSDGSSTTVSSLSKQQAKPPPWQGLAVDELPDTYATVVPTGHYSYLETETCQSKTMDCQIYFPSIDLANIIIKDELDNDENSNDESSKKQQNKRLKPLYSHSYDYDKLLSNMTEYGNNSIALLTRCGNKGAGELINQDRIVLVKYDESNPRPQLQQQHPYQLMALFDGHGIKGHVVSHAAAMILPKLLWSTMKNKDKKNKSKLHNNENNIHAAAAAALESLPPERMTPASLSHAILRLDKSLSPIKGAGATAIVIVHQPQQQEESSGAFLGTSTNNLDRTKKNTELVVANLGDSQAFVAEYDEVTQKTTIIFQTKQHKPHMMEERIRIEQAGGRVMLPQAPGDTSRVIVPIVSKDGETMMELGLAMSRSLGDFEAKRKGVTAIPTVNVISLTGKKQVFVVAATDGIFDYVTPDDVAQQLGYVLYSTGSTNGQRTSQRLMDACEKLIMKASRHWKERSGSTYRDDISILVTKLEL